MANTRDIGVCPFCGDAGEIYILLDTVGVCLDLYRNEVDEIASEVAMEDGLPRTDRIIPQGKYHCAMSTCDRFFDEPKWVLEADYNGYP